MIDDADLDHLLMIVSCDSAAGARLSAIVAEALERPDLRVGVAFGIGARRRRGERSPETKAELRRSNRALAQLRERFFRDLRITEAAEEIAAAGNRYEVSAWRFDREKPPEAIAGDQQRLMAEVLRGRSHFPRARRVRGLLRAMSSEAIHCRDSGAEERRGLKGT